MTDAELKRAVLTEALRLLRDERRREQADADERLNDHLRRLGYGVPTRRRRQ